MKIVFLSLLVALLPVGLVVAQVQPPLALGSVDARWEHVYCDLTELKRTATGELNVRFQYRTTKQSPHPMPNANLVAFTMALDPVNRTLYGVLKDASGNAISSTVLSGQSARPIPAGGTQAHWARLEAPPAGVTTVTVLVEGCLPFEDVAIGGAPAAPLRLAPAQAIASQDGEAAGVVVEITGVNRQVGEFVTISFRYRNTGSEVFGFPHARSVLNTYFLDNAGRRKYEVVRDQRQQPLCSETLGLHGQSGDKINPGDAMTFWATFASPPAEAGNVSVFLPYAPPFDDVAIAGAGGGSAAAGSAVAGAVMGVEAALKDLGAVVSETEIRIDLAADVLFDFDKADLKPVAEEKLNHLLTVVNSRPSFAVSIEGHTDIRGEASYNQALSLRRAESVRAWLTSHGVAVDRLTATGAGESSPLNSGETEEDHQANRRVEIRMTGTAAAGTGSQSALVAAVASGSQSAIKLQPGTWRLRVSSITNGVADPAQDTNVCISAEELSDLGSYFAPVLEDVEADCKKTRQPSADPGKIDYQMSCIGPKITVNSMTHVMIESINRFDLTIVIDSQTEIETGHVEASAQASWVGVCD